MKNILKNKILSLCICLIVFIIISSCFFLWYFRSSSNLGESIQEISENLPSDEVTSFTIKKNETIYSSLKNMGFSPKFIHNIIQVCKSDYDISKIKEGTRVDISLKKDMFSSMDEKFNYMKVYVSLDSRLIVSAEKDLSSEMSQVSYSSKLEKLEVKTTIVSFASQVKTSLWESAQSVGMDPELISALSDIFAWQIDFVREVRVSDRWRMSVEKKMIEGNFAGWGNILIAEYINQTVPYIGVRYSIDNGKSFSYYSLDGSSLRRMFLKSPLKYSRISSKFSLKRFHPVLKVNRPHNGVDYAAPVGTPVMSVGKGTVEFAGSKGASGIMVKIKHNSTYSTAYLHLKGVAKGIRKGVKVEQGQIIGYVGMTGMTSGPHCHFSFYENSRYVDPLGRKFPAEASVPKDKLADFKQKSLEAMALLPSW